MVGVPGKYKGCETCRLRRVKCDNQRPHCRKCLDGGRICAGYERETVFIIGTLDDRGRCSSHPPRVVNKASGTGGGSTGGSSSGSGSGSKKARSRSSTLVTKESVGGGGGGDEGKESGTVVEVVVDGEPRPAWDDLVQLDCRRPRQRRGRYSTQLAGLGTDLAGVVVRESGGGGSCLSLPAYGTPDVQLGMGTEELRLGPRCLVHLAAPDQGQGVAHSVCMFLYQHGNDPYFANQPHWKDPFVQSDNVLRAAPEQFRSFPAHHFFARFYRPNAIMTALLNRTPTFLAESQWLSVPFEIHPKAPLDRLFDNLAVLASLLPRADHVLSQEPTFARRLMAQELLNDCLDLEMEMGRWYTSLQHPSMSGSAGGGAGGKPLFWLSDSTVTRVNPPFNPLIFRDNHTALALSYYWAALVLFYPTIWRLYFAAVIDAVVVMDTTTTSNPPSYLPHHQPHQHQYQQHQYQQQQQQQLPQSTTPSMFTPLPIPPRLQDLDPMRYSLPQVRQIAGNVCRALDFLLLVLLPLPLLPPEGNKNSSSSSNNSNNTPVPLPGWAQPDLLWLPLLAVARLFRELGGIVSAQPGGASQAGAGMGMGMQMGVGMGLGMGAGLDMGLMDASSGDGGGGGGGEGRLVEEMWCDGLRERLLGRVGEMREVVAGRRWFDVASL
ncbi:hypothetical protein MYCTH_2303828 [Thermothelomyces thermophilus ATCC 42464]|uniref:Zn(2)-C6 fungal-type domain-containing protein n=1 Tax=Thermothelomyces thermophilus (strain ATCC 42464 / BCRC 31852 / DSM 1799) TaxID=573729 RepID=G2QDU2_THET4|nr:uncharacterized protein MYCTH_2303828 [Thermothelomyces thermophilus ATCC 42464]AEO57551.1 hypothetical protein MYCTH_2303828 [Thermothelomyces thermophilus ATCC 42464]